MRIRKVRCDVVAGVMGRKCAEGDIEQKLMIAIFLKKSHQLSETLTLKY
jgi:hypothetical protein